MLKTHTRRRLTRILIGAIILLAALHLLAVISNLQYPASFTGKHWRLIDLDQEYNIPTFYSGILLLTISMLALKLKKNATHFIRKLFWTLLSLMFAYWALDEVLIIHERSAEPIRQALSIQPASFLFHAWVVLALGVITVLGLAILIVLHLKKRPITRQQQGLLLTIFFYMLGVVSLEMLGTKVYGNEYLYRLVMVPLEELFEFSMASLIIVKLVRFRHGS